jgi:hypothetical protein
MINISDETVHSCFMLKLLTNLVVLCDFLENWAAPNFHSGVEVNPSSCTCKWYKV